MLQCTASHRGGDLQAVAGVTLPVTLQELEKQAAVAAAREEGKTSAAEQVGRPLLEHQPFAVLFTHRTRMRCHARTAMQGNSLLTCKGHVSW